MGRFTSERGSMCMACVYDDICKGRTCINETIYQKLKHYEDLEEQGRLIELPCAVGDRVYYIGAIDNSNKVCVLEVETIDEALFFKGAECGLKKGFYLTKEEAEAKLKELEG